MINYEKGLLMLDELPLNPIPTTLESEPFLKPSYEDQGEIVCELGLLEEFATEMKGWLAAIRKDIKENW